MEQPSAPQQPTPPPATTVVPATSQPSMGLAVAAMILGILAFLSGFIWWIAAPFAITSLVLAIISLAKKMGGKGMAITGIVLSAIALLFTTMITFIFVAATPSLETSVRDSQRKVDAATVSSAIQAYMTANRGEMPAPSNTTMENINGVGGTNLLNPTNDLPYNVVEGQSPDPGTFGYAPGIDCDGVSKDRVYSVTIMTEKGDIYCTSN